MNTYSTRKESGGPFKAASRSTLSMPRNRTDPADTAQEAVHRVLPRNDMSPALRAVRGDDDLVSKQQHQSMPCVDGINGTWKQQIAAARIAWGKLTEDELLKSEGHAQKLARLLQAHYALTHDEVDRQIRTFFGQRAA